MRVALLTREFPPEVYGGAGVHVEHLAAALEPLVDVAVYCYGAPRPSPLVAAAFQPWAELPDGVLANLSVNLAMAGQAGEADLVHSHTWYTNLGGHLAKLLSGIPHVVTSHSLEPLRPWKADQLGSGYAVSSFCERAAMEAADAVIAVSTAMRDDLLAAYPAVASERVSVIHNGIDADRYRPVDGHRALVRYGLSRDAPIVLFVGRLTPQKGVAQLLDAAEHLDPSAQLVLCAGLADTPNFAAEVTRRVERLRRRRGGVVWLSGMLEREEVIELLSAATVFVCPSQYEPFGLVNLEAMACETAVVASAVGGIPEVVVDGETGFLVGTEAPDQFPARLAARINELVEDPERARQFGKAGRERVLERFSWPAVARRTLAIYERVLADT